MNAKSKGQLAGRTAIVTGSGQNIGRAIALAYAREGANVVINGHRNRQLVDEVVAEAKALGADAMGVMADVGDPDAVAAMVAQAQERFGAVDIAVSNVALRRMQAFLEISLEDWHRVMDTNLNAAFYLARSVLPRMRERKWGRLVHVSGFDAFWGHVTDRAHSVTAKSGLHGLTKALAREFGRDGITANTLSPGAIDTERDWSQYQHQPKAELEKQIPLGRFGDVDEVAAACLFLASDAGGFVSGQVLHVNGGHYMY